ARERIRRDTSIVPAVGEVLTALAIDEIFRDVHTLKGEARSFDLADLEEVASALEEELDRLRAAARVSEVKVTASVHAQLTTCLAGAGAALERGCELFVAASPIGRAVFDQVTVRKSDLDALVEKVSDSRASIVPLVERLAARPLGESV